jgi:hypothetical protein
VVPLNAGNVFGAEDGRPALAWESLIRGALRRAQPSKPKYRCYSHPPSPSRFDPSNDAAAELLPGGTDTETDTDDDAPSSLPSLAHPEPYATPTPRRLSRLKHFSFADDSDLEQQKEEEPAPAAQQRTLLRSLSRADRVGLLWPEQPLDLLPARTLSTAPSFRPYRSFPGSSLVADVPAGADALDVDLDVALRKRSRSPFVRIVSKQMVGIFLTVWVRRGIRKCVQNVKVSTVGVGAMGYIGNKVRFFSAFSHRSHTLTKKRNGAKVGLFDLCCAGSGVSEHVDIPEHVLLRVFPPRLRREARRRPQAERRRSGDPPPDAFRRAGRLAALQRHLRPRVSAWRLTLKLCICIESFHQISVQRTNLLLGD